MPAALHPYRPQDFAEPLSKPWRAKNFREEQECLPGVWDFRDGQQRFAEFRVGRKLFDACVEPAIHFRVGGSEVRLQPERIAFRIVDEEAGVDAEKTRQEIAGRLRQMGP